MQSNIVAILLRWLAPSNDGRVVSANLSRPGTTGCRPVKVLQDECIQWLGTMECRCSGHEDTEQVLVGPLKPKPCTHPKDHWSDVQHSLGIMRRNNIGVHANRRVNAAQKELLWNWWY